MMPILPPRIVPVDVIPRQTFDDGIFQFVCPVVYCRVPVRSYNCRTVPAKAHAFRSRMTAALVRPAKHKEGQRPWSERRKRWFILYSFSRYFTDLGCLLKATNQRGTLSFAVCTSFFALPDISPDPLHTHAVLAKHVLLECYLKSSDCIHEAETVAFVWRITRN